MTKWVQITSPEGQELKLKLTLTPKLELVTGWAEPLEERWKNREPIHTLEELSRFGFEVPDIYADLIDLFEEESERETWQ